MTVTLFSSLWCAPCQKIKPLINSLKLKYSIQSVDVDDNPQLAKKHHIRSLPTAIVLNGDKEIARLIGTSDIKKLESILAKVA